MKNRIQGQDHQEEEDLVQAHENVLVVIEEDQEVLQVLAVHQILAQDQLLGIGMKIKSIENQETKIATEKMIRKMIKKKKEGGRMMARRREEDVRTQGQDQDQDLGQDPALVEMMQKLMVGTARNLSKFTFSFFLSFFLFSFWLLIKNLIKKKFFFPKFTIEAQSKNIFIFSLLF